MKNFKKISEEVIVSKSHLEQLSHKNINFLISKAKNNKSRKFRLCSHESDNDPVHEMFIVHPKGIYVRPHRHLNKSESILIIEGCMDYITFENDGKLKDRIILGDYKSKKKFYLTNKENSFHSLIIKSDWCVFLEIIEGPFERNKTEFAVWSPEITDKNGIKSFFKKYKGNL